MTTSSKHLAGLMTGQFSVGASGQPTYQIPIAVPPGTARMQPHLTLKYTGGQSDGLLGVGWRLSGLGTIRRVGQTPAQDGRWSSVNYSDSDRFALNGERLIAISGADGGDGAEYRTEIDSWSKVVSHGSVGGGPESFTVATKSGLVMRFGADAGSRVAATGQTAIRLWALTDICDLTGNCLSFTYDQDLSTGSYRPARIDYTANSGLTPPLTSSRAVLFGYESRSEPVVSYEGGFRICQMYRLSSITTQLRGETAMQYALEYAEDPVTLRSYLSRVSQTDAGGATLPPVSFDWLPNSVNPFDSPISLPPVPGLPVDQVYMTFTIDLTGDGHTDLVRVWSDANNMLSYAVFLADCNGYGSPIIGSTQLPFLGVSPALVPVDINGDGATDLVYFYHDGQDLRFSTLIWNGSAFDVSPPQDPQLTELDPYFIPQIAPVDVDGDGRTDLVIPFGSNYRLNYYVMLSNGSTYVSQQVTRTTAPMPESYKLTPARVTGSAQQDFVYAAWSDDNNGGEMQFHTFISTGAGFTQAPPVSIPMESDAYSHILPVDVTGDGLTDIAFVWLDGDNYKLRVLVADGTRIRLPDNEPFPVTLPGSVGALMAASLSSGPRTDLLYVSNEGDTTALTPYVARHGSYVALPSINTGLQVLTTAVSTPDVFGVGRSDVLVQAVDPTGSKLALQLYSAAKPAAGRIGTFHNGIGGSILVDYSPLTDPDVYQQSSSGTGKRMIGAASRAAAASGMTVQMGPGAGPSSIGGRPFRDGFEGPLFVVAGYEVSDGRGATYHRLRRYCDGAISTDGRGWLGFVEVAHTNVEDQAVVSTAYEQAFPLTGRAVSIDWAWSTAADAIRTKKYSYVVLHPAESSGVFQVMRQKTTTTTHRGSVGSAGAFTVEHRYDDYGNAISTSYTSDTGAGVVPDLYRHRTFSNDPSTWTLGLLTESVDSADPAGSMTLRKRSFNYNKSTRQLIQKTLWNDSSPEQSLTVSYTYDGVGNRIGVVTNSGSVTTTTYDPDTDYTFPSSRNRVTGGSSPLRDSYLYNLTCGRWISHTNPNGVVRTRVLDGLGRVLTLCGPGPAGAPVVLLTRARTLAQTSGYTVETRRLQSWKAAQWRVTERSFDGLGRQFLETRTGIGDAVAPLLRSVSRRLDSRGRVVGESLPWLPGDPMLWRTKKYDPLSRVIELTQPLGGGLDLTTKVIYDGMDRIAIRGQNSPDESTTIQRLAYCAGKTVVVESIDQLGNLTAFNYDALGRILAAAPPESGPQQVSYDSIGARHVVSGPDFGTVSFSTDYLGRSVTVRFANGRWFTRAYDVLGRLVSIVMDDGSRYELVYDEASGKAVGKLSSVQSFSSTGSIVFTKTFAYDDYGRTTKIQLTKDAETYISDYRFTPAGLADARTFPDGSSAYHAFNGVGQLVGIDYLPSGGAARQRISTYHGYNAFGQAGRIEHGNRTTTIFEYTPWGAVALQQVIDGAGKAIFGRRMLHSDLGQVIAVLDSVTNKTIAAYQYDLSGRIKSATLGNSAATPFRYHRSGDITALGQTQLTYRNGAIEVTPGGNPPYSILCDAAGNRTRVASSEKSREAQYSYNARNQLIAVNRGGLTVEFLYDHAGRRLVKSSAAGEHLYVTPQYAVESAAGSDRVGTKLLHDQQGAAAIIRASGCGGPELVHYLERNQVGSTMLVTDASGGVVRQFQYEIYGAQVDGSPSALLMPTFGGKQYDEETGLYYFAARYYDPAIGRFITPDSRIGGPLHRPGTLNRFAYVLNDPINLTDPTGHGLFDWLGSFFIDAVEIVAGIIAGALDVVPLAKVLIGAGIGGAIYDVTALASGSNFSWAYWGIAEGAGAFLGAMGGEGAEPAADAGPPVDGGGPPADGGGPPADGGGPPADGGGPGNDDGGGGPGNDGGDGPQDDHYDDGGPQYHASDYEEFEDQELLNDPQNVQDEIDYGPNGQPQNVEDVPYYEGPDSVDATNSSSEETSEEGTSEDFVGRWFEGDKENENPNANNLGWG